MMTTIDGFHVDSNDSEINLDLSNDVDRPLLNPIVSTLSSLDPQFNPLSTSNLNATLKSSKTLQNTSDTLLYSQNRAQRKYLQRKNRQKSKKLTKSSLLQSQPSLSISNGDISIQTKQITSNQKIETHSIYIQDQKIEKIEKSNPNSDDSKKINKMDINSDQSTIPLPSQNESNETTINIEETQLSKSMPNIEIEYISTNLNDILLDDEMDAKQMEEFQAIFEAFQSNQSNSSNISDHITQSEQTNIVESNRNEAVKLNDHNQIDQDDLSNTNTLASSKSVSRRQRRLARRLSIALIKQLVTRPDLVEIHDTCCMDPFLLIHLKSLRGTVSVPRHWSQKRKYLQGKRGIEKAPFQLPDFVRNTGISTLRQAALERAEQQKLKAKQRERLRPKMGQLDIDYHVLYEAFFRYQTKPNLSRFGELYYENKEFELKGHDFVAGYLSENLRMSLGMINEATPPPWLIKMQRIGPPPSYPNLRIPGLNAPIPSGAQYGFHAGGWGSAPIDMYGRPIWGWVENQSPIEYQVIGNQVIPIDKNLLWGNLQYEEAMEEFENQENGSENESQMDQESQNIPPPPSISLNSTSMDSSRIPTSGLTTPIPSSAVNLRKFKREPTNIVVNQNQPQTAPLQPHQLFQVLPQQPSHISSQQIFGSDHTYVMNPLQKKRVTEFIGSAAQPKVSDLNITLDHSDLELSEEQLTQKYQKLFLEHEREQVQPNVVVTLSEAERNEFFRKGLPKEKEKKKDYKF